MPKTCDRASRSRGGRRLNPSRGPSLKWPASAPELTQNASDEKGKAIPPCPRAQSQEFRCQFWCQFRCPTAGC